MLYSRLATSEFFRDESICVEGSRRRRRGVGASIERVHDDYAMNCAEAPTLVRDMQ